MKHSDAKEIVSRAKLALGVKTDTQLANELMVPRATVASWKRRGSVPIEYLAVVAGYGVSLDWLVFGNGPESSLDGLDIPTGEPSDIDIEALKIAMILSARRLADLAQKDAELLKFTDGVSSENLDVFHLYTCRFFDEVSASKNRWKKSKLIPSENIYEALRVEFDLSEAHTDFEPWWRRD